MLRLICTNPTFCSAKMYGSILQRGFDDSEIAALNWSTLSILMTSIFILFSINILLTLNLHIEVVSASFVRFTIDLYNLS